MASAEQIKALLKSHMDGDDYRFFSVAMQGRRPQGEARSRQAR